MRNKVRSATRYDFKAYVDFVIEDLCHDQKPFWNWINKLRCCRNPIFQFTTTMNLLLMILRLAYLISIFISVFTKEDLSGLPKVPPFCSGFTLDQFSATPSEVFAKLSVLNTSKACGPDGICP